MPLGYIILLMIYIGHDHPSYWLHPIIKDLLAGQPLEGGPIYRVLDGMYYPEWDNETDQSIIYYLKDDIPDGWYDHLMHGELKCTLTLT